MGRDLWNKECRRLRVAAYALLGGSACALSGNACALPDEGDLRDETYVHFYVAQWSRTRFNQILRLKTDRDDSYLASIALGRPFRKLGDNSRMEWEAQVAKHWGPQDHVEIAAATSIRWYGFPWDRRFRNTFALGTGLSYALSVPVIEEQGDNESTYLLVQLLAEVTIAPPGPHNWRLFTRAHHRSGVFGLVADSGSSNFIGLGLRRHF